MKNAMELKLLDNYLEIRRQSLQNERASDHIIISHFDHGVSFFYKNTRLFNTRNGLLLFEKGYSPILYVPKADVFQHQLFTGTKTSQCPYKGEATYWSLKTTEEIVLDIAWEYAKPVPGIEIIAEHLAFANSSDSGRYIIYTD